MLPRVQAFFVATIFVLLSVPVSLYEIAMHLENFSRPKLQTRIIRILFMVPIYALDRCVSMFTHVCKS
jgi:Organic solute transporter Ostalpha